MSIEDDMFERRNLNKDRSTDQITPLQFQTVTEYTRSQWLTAQSASQKQITPYVLDPEGTALNHQIDKFNSNFSSSAQQRKACKYSRTKLKIELGQIRAGLK